MELFKRDNLIYTLIGISSCITYLFGHHAYLSQTMKILLGLSNFAAVCIMIRRNIELNEEKQSLVHKICVFLVLYAGVNITMSLTHAPGRFQTFVFSPFYLMVYLLPLFYIIVDDFGFFRKFFKLYVIVSIISIFSFRGYGLISYFVAIFFPLIIRNKKLILLTCIILLLDLTYSFNIFGNLSGTQRQVGLEMVICSMTVYVVWIKRNIKFAKAISFVLCVMPIAIWIMFLVYKVSIFEKLSLDIDDPVMSQDTRTFLYHELFANLHSLKDWVFGFGVDGGYTSAWFGSNEIAGKRETTEVTMLHLILKGGLVLLFAYIIIILKGIVTGFRYGQNKLVFASSLTLSGHLLCMCIGDYPSRSLLIQIVPFIMVGLCTSECILSLTDEDLNNILEFE